MRPDKDCTPERILVLAGLARSLINFRGPLIKALTEAGLEVHAAAPELTRNSETQKTLAGWGVICHDFPIERAGINPVGDIRGFLALYNLVRVVRPDALLGYTIKPVIYGTLAAWLAKVPRRFALITGLGYAFSETASIKGKFVQGLAQKLYGAALSRASLVFCQNPDDEALLRELNVVPKTVSSVVVNGSGIDLSQFKQAPLPRENIVFLLIARLLGAKGIREYVAAAREVRAENSSVIFKLVGDIDDNPDSVRAGEVEQWVSEGVLDYLGRLEDVRPAIASASVYVLPSYYPEGTPRTVLESMAMGRAVITTDSPGCRETVVDGENGYLVPVRSVTELVMAMQRFIYSPELVAQMGARSRQIAEDKYDVHKVNLVMLSAMGIKPEC